VTATEAPPTTNRRIERRTALGAGVLALLLALGWIWWSRPSPVAAGGYIVEAADRGAIAVIVTATGTVNPVTTVQVGTYVSGPIREIFVDFNSPVRKGQIVAKIDPRPFQVKVQQEEANLANARARVAKARADLALKQRSLERTRALRGEAMIAESALDAAKSEFEQARAQLALDEAAVQQAQAQLEEARINLGYTDITSPVDGVVVSRSVDVGQTVAATFQTPTLFQIAQDLTRMQVNAKVSESDIGGVREGQPASFGVDAHPGRRFEGRVVQVRNAPQNVQNVVSYEVMIEVANADLALKPGMTATVAIETARKDDVVRVPMRALRFRPADAPPDAASAVWGVEGEDVRRIPVTIGLRNDEHAEVVGGDVEPGRQLATGLAAPPAEDAPPPQSPFQPRRR
jgi:HlyD family secretion protein